MNVDIKLGTKTFFAIIPTLVLLMACKPSQVIETIDTVNKVAAVTIAVEELGATKDKVLAMPIGETNKELIQKAYLNVKTVAEGYQKPESALIKLPQLKADLATVADNYLMVYDTLAKELTRPGTNYSHTLVTELSAYDGYARTAYELALQRVAELDEVISQDTATKPVIDLVNNIQKVLRIYSK